MPPDYEHGSYQHSNIRELVPASCISPSRPVQCCFGEAINLKAVKHALGAVRLEEKPIDTQRMVKAISKQKKHYPLPWLYQALKGYNQAKKKLDSNIDKYIEGLK